MSTRKPRRQRPIELTARAVRRKDEGWARHANSHNRPTSGWTRIVTGLPVLLLMTWRVPRAPLSALTIASAGATWLWLDPRPFAPARDNSAWAGRAVFGERLWLDRPASALPRRFVTRASWRNALVGVGIGASTMATAGVAVNFIAQFASIDHMARMYAEMMAADLSLHFGRPS